MKRILAVVLGCTLWPIWAHAQTDVALLAFTVPQGIDVRRDVDVEYGAGATGNAAKLNAAIANTANQKPFLFTGGRCDINDGPVVVPQRWGYVFSGGGRASIQNEGSVNTGPSPRIIQMTPRVTFNGGTVTASTSGANATITLSGSGGWTVVASDVGRTLEIINPGGPWLAGWYVVTNADPGNNTWTLDRACTSATASGMTGMATETLWYDRGAGNVYSGLGFRGNVTPNPANATFNGTTVTATTSDASATIDVSGLTVGASHVGATLSITGGTNFIAGTYTVTNWIPISNSLVLSAICSTGSANGMIGTLSPKALKTHVGLHVEALDNNIFPNGKHTISNCSFGDFSAGILIGYDMRQAFASAASYTGDSYSFGDHTQAFHNTFRNCKVGVLVRARQSCNHEFFGDAFSGCEACYYFERGGGSTIRRAEAAGVSPTMLRIGAANSNSGNYTLDTCGFDGAASNPQFVAFDQAGGAHGSVLVKNCWIDGGITSFSRPQYDIKGGIALTIINGNRLRPDAIKLAASNGGYRPVVWLQMCHIENASGGTLADWEDVIDDAGSSAGCVAYVRGCHSFNNQTHYDGEKFITGTGIVRMSPLEKHQLDIAEALIDRGANPDAAIDWLSSPECLAPFVPDAGSALLAQSEPFLAIAP